MPDRDPQVVQASVCWQWSKVNWRDCRRNTEAVTQAANTDALTGLTNRRGWREHAPELFAHSLREALAQDPDPLTFSGGIAQRRPGEDLQDLLGRGDAAMYRAKQAGRDRVMPAG